MSMENAILELAAAIRELAGSNKSKVENFGAWEKALAAGFDMTAPGNGAPVPDTELDGAELDAELEQAVEKVEAAAKEEQTQVIDKKELQKAIAEEKARIAAEADEPAAALDYKADVEPALIKLAKAKGKPALLALLGEFEVANAQKLTAEQYGAVVARAAELAA